MFDRIVRNVGAFTNLQAALGADKPLVSLWLTGLKETVDQLPDFVRLAARIGVKEVHLQRLVFDEAGFGMARADSSLFEQTRADEEAVIADAAELGRGLGVLLDASGANRAGVELEAAGRRQAVVDVPPAVVADVFHRAWPGAALLHRAVLGPRLRELHAGQRLAAGPGRDLERSRPTGTSAPRW